MAQNSAFYQQHPVPFNQPAYPSQQPRTAHIPHRNTSQTFHAQSYDARLYPQTQLPSQQPTSYQSHDMYNGQQAQPRSRQSSGFQPQQVAFSQPPPEPSYPPQRQRTYSQQSYHPPPSQPQQHYPPQTPQPYLSHGQSHPPPAPSVHSRPAHIQQQPRHQPRRSTGFTPTHPVPTQVTYQAPVPSNAIVYPAQPQQIPQYPTHQHRPVSISHTPQPIPLVAPHPHTQPSHSQAYQHSAPQPQPQQQLPTQTKPQSPTRRPLPAPKARAESLPPQPIPSNTPFPSIARPFQTPVSATSSLLFSDSTASSPRSASPANSSPTRATSRPLPTPVLRQKQASLEFGSHPGPEKGRGKNFSDNSESNSPARSTSPFKASHRVKSSSVSVPSSSSSNLSSSRHPDPLPPLKESNGSSTNFIPHWKRPLPNSPTKTPDLASVREGKGNPPIGFGKEGSDATRDKNMSGGDESGRKLVGDVTPQNVHVGMERSKAVNGTGSKEDGNGTRSTGVPQKNGGVRRNNTVSKIASRFEANSGRGVVNQRGVPVPAGKAATEPGSISMERNKAVTNDGSGGTSDVRSGRPLPASPTTAPDISKLAKGQSGRPIPTRNQTMPTPMTAPNPLSESDDSSDEEDEESAQSEQGVASSPQWGIRDLPSRGAENLPQPPRPVTTSNSRSMTLQFAALELNGQPAVASAAPTSSSSITTPSRRQLPPTAGPGTVWPANVAKLPRTPNIHGAPVSITVDVKGKGKQRELVNLDDEPPRSLRSPSPSSISSHSQRLPGIQPRPPSQSQPLPAQPRSPSEPSHSQPHARWQPIISTNANAPKIESPAPVGGRDKRADIPKISFPAGEDDSDESDSDDWHAGGAPSIVLSGPELPRISVSELPSISISDAPSISVSVPEISISSSQTAAPVPSSPSKRGLPQPPQLKPIHRGGGLICGGCGGAIIGRIVNAMGIRWHPGCFRCSVCNELLEHVSSYEHEGRPYCHLDYHESFAPRCYSCKTAIIDERFITLDDEALGKRTYHEQHFFCAECGDPFLAPSKSHPRSGEGLTVTGDGSFSDEDVGFTVYKGHPYCEACHVRLRLPKCKKCKRSIRDGARAVEALGGKWCWECFVCAGCEKPFEDPSFFERDAKPFCEPCFSIILRNEL